MVQVQLMRVLATELAPHRIRVNTIHPSGVSSPMSNNDFFPTWMTENPALGDGMRGNLMPIDALPESDVSDVAKWMAGGTIGVDAGFLLK